MFDTPLDLDYGMRLDNIAYENMGVKEVWYIRDTVILLTSFEMEINGYFARPDHEYCYSRIYDKYRTYIFNCITKRQIVFDDGLDDETRKRNDAEGLIGFDLHDTCFYKNDIINHLANNKGLFFDTESLYEYLSGCSDHRISITYTFDQGPKNNGGSSANLDPVSDELSQHISSKGEARTPHSNTFNAETGKVNSDKRWSKNRAAKRRITDRVTFELTRPMCICNQVQIKDFICNYAEEVNRPGKMFWDDTELSGAVVSEVIRQHVKEHFPDRFSDQRMKVVACPVHTS